MKNLICCALLSLLLWGPKSVQAQCTPDETMASATNYPATWATGCVGRPYSETVYISFPIDSVISGVNVVFDGFEVIASSLPPGLSYSLNVGGNTWTPSNTPTSQELIFGCITISGTPTQAFSGAATFDIEGCGTVLIITQCSTEVLSFNVDIVDPPVPDFSSSANQGDITFTDLTMAGDSITSYLWNFGDGGTSNDSNPTHTYTSNGTYNVCLSVVTASGCSAQSCDSVSVTMVDIDPATIFARQVDLFPNPASNEVRLRIAKATQPQVILRSMDGRLLRKWTFKGTNANFETELDLSGLASGLYFLDIRSREGVVVKTLSIE